MVEKDFLVADFICKNFLIGKLGLIDVGSHEGSFIKFLQNSCKNSIIIEPLPEKFEMICRAFQNAYKFNCAISDVDGFADLYVTINFSQCSALYDRPAYNEIKDLNDRKKIKIMTRRLDSIFDEISFKSLDIDSWYLKIDTEGYEMETLKSLGKYISSKNIVAGQFEYGGTWKERNLTLLEAVDFLSKNDFYIYRCTLDKNSFIFDKIVSCTDDYQYDNFFFVRKHIPLNIEKINANNF